MKTIRAALALLLILGFGGAARAQSRSGTIFGVVTDSSGGVLPGAVVVGLWLEAGLVDAVLAPPQAAAASASTPRPATMGRVLAVTVGRDMS